MSPTHSGPPSPTAPQRLSPGLLVSTEGVNGVGKTYLVGQVAAQLARDSANAVPVIVEEFSRRAHGGNDLGRQILRALVDASGRDRFLRGGHPASETMLLLAIKTHDYEASRDALTAGRLVLEGRSLHTVAVYQSLILHPDDDDAAHEHARQILALAACWRPLPDLTILVTDDVAAAVRRAEQRDAIPYTPEQWRLHRRAAALFDRLAGDDPDRIRVLDRRTTDAEHAATQMRDWIDTYRMVGATRGEPITPADSALATPAGTAAR